MGLKSNGGARHSIEEKIEININVINDDGAQR